MKKNTAWDLDQKGVKQGVKYVRGEVKTREISLMLSIIMTKIVLQDETTTNTLLFRSFESRGFTEFVHSPKLLPHTTHQCQKPSPEVYGVITTGKSLSVSCLKRFVYKNNLRSRKGDKVIASERDRFPRDCYMVSIWYGSYQ